MILADTSVLIDFLRGNNLPGAAKLRQLEVEAIPYGLPAICCQEVLQGARDEREWDLLVQYLGGQRKVFPRDPWSAHVEAARIAFDCRRRGLTIRSSADCFIAHLVLEQDGVLLHNDEDFERIREVRPLRTLRS